MKVFIGSFREVFTRRGYLLLLGGFSVLATLTASIGIQWPNLVSILTTDILPLTAKLRLSILLMRHPGARTDMWTLWMVYLLAVMIALSLTLNVYAVRELRMEKSWLGQAGGVLLGTIGFGCAACGTFVLSGFLSTAATAALVSVLPFRGKEFLAAGTVLIGISIYRTAKSIYEKTCAIPVKV